MRDKTIKRLFVFIRPYRAYLLLSVTSAAVSAFFTLFIPILIGKGIDCAIGVGNVLYSELAERLILFAAVMAAASLFGWLMAFFNSKLAFKTVMDLRREIFKKLQRTSLAELDGTPAGDIINRMINDTDAVSDGLLSALNRFISGMVIIIGTIIFMLTQSPLITAVVVFMTPLSMFVAVFIARGSFKYFKKQTTSQSRLVAILNDIIGNDRLICNYSYEERAQELFDAENRTLYACGRRAQFYSALANPCTRFVNALVYAAVGVVGAILAIYGSMTVGAITTFLVYSSQYTKPFNEISEIITQLQSAHASVKRVFALLDLPEEDTGGGNAVSTVSHDIDFRNVCFSYSAEKEFIKNLSFTVRNGGRTAIVGPTGCGKTTLINLIMRFYDVTGGEILLGGTDIRSIKRMELRSGIGMVLQDSRLFTGTVRDNIAYSKPDATEEEIVDAAVRAHAHDFIKKLSHGYNTVIEPDGGGISAGQKQLLCIARVMLCAPPVLILDEATSSIDTRTELLIGDAFAEMMRGKTSLIVAHRLSTIRNAGLIIVMDGGRIVESGTHDELMAKGGFYSELYMAMIN